MVEIPEEVKDDVKVVLGRLNNVFPKGDDVKFLMEVYYRYVANPHKNKSVEDTVKDNIGCATCRSAVVSYFKSVVHYW